MDPAQRRSLHQKMSRLAAGDRSVLDEVMAQFWPVVRRFTGRLLSHDADDAAQEAIVKVFARITDLDPARDALTWALTVASFEVKTVRKRRQRCREVGEAGLGTVEAGVDPQGILEGTALREALGEAVGELSAADQDILAYWLERDESGPMVAAERKRKQRALDRLSTIWRRNHGLGSDL